MPTPRGDCKLSTRQALSGWLFITQHGCAWRAPPECVFSELRRLESDVGPPAERVHPDSTIVKLHQDGASAPEERGVSRSSARAGAQRPAAAGHGPDAWPVRDAPWGRHLLEQRGPPIGPPQLIDDRAYEDQPSRNDARGLGWELVAPPRPNRDAARQHPLDRAA